MQQSLHADERASTGGMRRVCVIRPVSYEQMPGLLKSFDVLVLPSVTIVPLHREQFGRVLIEAMAAGVPVVGSSSGAIPEVIGDAGLVVPERDATALAQAIDRVLAEPGLRETLVQRDQTVDLFREAVAHRQRALARLPAVSV
jgi:glycosyltransferase involved in cell wall biosynthesis